MSARPRARRKAERPGEILEAAFEEFSEKGFVAARLEDVARRAGVTKGTIYVYFPTKEAVFLAMSEAFSKEMGGGPLVFWRRRLRRARLWPKRLWITSTT